MTICEAQMQAIADMVTSEMAKRFAEIEKKLFQKFPMNKMDDFEDFE